MDSLDRQLLDNRSDDSPQKRTKRLTEHDVEHQRKEPSRKELAPIIRLIRTSNDNSANKKTSEDASVPRNGSRHSNAGSNSGFRQMPSMSQFSAN